MWLVSEKGMFLGQAFTNLFQDPGNTSIHRQRREKTKAGLRYSRSSHRVKNDTAITGVDPVLHNTTLDTGQGAIVRLRTKEGFSVSPAALLGWADRYLFRENILLRMAFGALAALVQGAWAVIAGGYVYYDLLGALFSVMAAPLLVYLFYAATDRHMRTSSLREAGILATLAILTYSLSGFDLPYLQLNIGQMAAFAAAVLTGGSYGISRGTLVGLACGLFLEPVYALSYALAGLVAGTVSEASGTSPLAVWGKGGARPIGLLAAGAVATAWGIVSSGYGGIRYLLPEILMASAILMPFLSAGKLQLPSHWCGLITDTRRSEKAAIAEKGTIISHILIRFIFALKDVSPPPRMMPLSQAT